MAEFLEHILGIIAPTISTALEIVGIIIIAVGSLKALGKVIKNRFAFEDNSTKIILGEALALSLEFKLGAEIIKTVIVRSIDELVVLGIIVVLRVILTFVIHWEVEQAGADDEKKKSLKKEG